MLCEDYEVFLEMGHVLKGLEVSILKGVLEHRSGKLWACVVVEVHQRLPLLCFQPIVVFGVVHQRLIIPQSTCS